MNFILYNLTNLYQIIIFLLTIQTSLQYIYACNASEACGCSDNAASVTRIVGGQSARSTSWSWAVSLLINGDSLCGGAILSSSWVITAAHCIDGVSASNVRVYAGTNTKFGGSYSSVSNIIKHSGYISSSKINDIALLRLSSGLSMSNTIKSICMPSVSASILSSGEWPEADLYVVAVGYGTLYENGPTSSSLQQVTVQAIDYRDSSCRQVLYNRQYQFCAGVEGGGKDTCQGDSGGPLMMFTESNQWVLVGLTSYGRGCARENYAGVYTRVAEYKDWVSSNTNGAITYATSSVSARINPNGSPRTICVSFIFLIFSVLLTFAQMCTHISF